MMGREGKHKHLELIQGIISRLSTNSFFLKGWSIVLVTALFALFAPDSQSDFVLLAFIPAIIFWGLDGFFLWQEQLYRKLYDYVRVQQDEDIDFSMDTAPFKTGDNPPTWCDAILSRTLISFYGALIVSIIAVIILT